jgi:hypothetical protein
VKTKKNPKGFFFCLVKGKEDKLTDFPWFHIEEMNTDGIFAMLTEHPFDPNMEQIEKDAQDYLCIEKFNGKGKDYPHI